MKISVITVVYNAIASLEKTMLSILNQTYSNIEYIVVDGGSTDGSLDLIAKYQDRIDQFISEPDKGIYDAMNKGLELASGDFALFLNAGDSFFEDDIIENVVAKIKDLNALYYGDVYMSGIRKLYWGKFSKYKLAIGNICHQGVFYPKSIYKQNKYDLTYKVYADYYYNLSIYPKCDFIFLDETISMFEAGGFSSFAKDKPFEKVVGKLIIKNLGYLPYFVRLFYWSLVDIKRLLR